MPNIYTKLATIAVLPTGMLYQATMAFTTHSAAVYGLSLALGLQDSDDEQSVRIWTALSISAGVCNVLQYGFKQLSPVEEDTVLSATYDAMFKPASSVVKKQFFSQKEKDVGVQCGDDVELSDVMMMRHT